jgi:DNA-binding MarR family transcriptional regulator
MPRHGSGGRSDRHREPGRRPRTWLFLTAAGREALAAHLAALREIAG